MSYAPLTLVFSSVGFFYGLLVPLVCILMFTLLLIPSLMRSNARPEAVGHASFAYMAQAVGVLFMTMGGIPAFYSVLGNQPLSSAVYSALLLVFAIGGVLFLWQDGNLRHIDAASRAVPAVIFFYMWKFIGLMAMLLAGLSFVLRLTLSGGMLPSGWWSAHLLFFVYGMLLSWFTAHRPKNAQIAFSSVSMKPMMAAPAARVHKPSPKKTAKKRR